MNQEHENYKQLIWTLAKTDFTLRYHGSILGYAWAILKPLLMFSVMYFVFSSVFNPRNTGTEYYAIQLLIGIMMFTFFSEGTMAGMTSLLSKSQLVTKIYVPRWCIIVASTVNGAMIFTMNLLIIVLFCIIFQFLPSFGSVLFFLVAAVCIYILVVAFSLITAPLLIKFRDLQMIWEVLTSILFYASPIIYPLSMLPANVRQIILLNPIAFIIHFTKEALINNRFMDPIQAVVFITALLALAGISVLLYQRFNKKIAEYM